MFLGSMFRRNKKYGTFAQKTFWDKHSKFGRITAITLTSLIVVTSLAVTLFNRDKKNQNTVSLPYAVASEIPGWWYGEHFGSSICDAEDCKPAADPDQDKLSNDQEFYFRSDPWNWDTNGNGLNDGEDVARNFDPSKPGNVTFEQAASDDNILGESLAFDEDIKKAFSESVNLDRVRLPLPEDYELTIIADDSYESYQKYALELEATIEKYFPRDSLNTITAGIESSNGPGLDEIKTKSAVLARELKRIPVPKSLLLFHKYNITLYELLPQIVPAPPQNIVSSLVQQDDVWYDKAQAFLVIMQKLNYETERLNRGLGL